MSHNLSALSGRKGLEDNLFDRMGQLSQQQGAPEPAELERLGREFLVGTAALHGAASFYDFTRPDNQGKKVYVCNGSACHCAGTQQHVYGQLRHHFDEAEIGHMTCLGRCYENSAFHYQGHNYSGENIDSLEAILRQPTQLPQGYAVRHHGRSILTQPHTDGRDRLKAWLQRTPEEVLKEIQVAQLRGRGGAGFPIGQKLAFCRQAAGADKFIICNADEGDPGAFSDRYLLEEQPARVVEGMLIAAYAAGANSGLLYIRAEYPEAVRRIESVVKAFYAQGLLGDRILGSDFSFQLRVIKAQGAYICGEETALINSVEGQRPEVRTRPPYPAVQGLFNMPTVVNNVETLACLPWIAEQGGAAFAAIGSEQSKGTKLISLDGFFNRPGIVEVEMGTPLEVVIYELGGGFRKPVKALHIGGPLGGLLPLQLIGQLSVDFSTFAQAGLLLGHASVLCIPQEMRLIDYLAHLFAFAAYESCGKCFPCRLGTKRAEELLTAAAGGGVPIDRQLFDDLLFTLQTGSLCAHGGGIPLPVRNAMQWFPEELAPYFSV
jgi:NADH:ubiquinone oxidoreductase subunit F (NADH-binding)/NADH:ubiquinone oxidoreductase subunit E